jgi:hypothetical protein
MLVKEAPCQKILDRVRTLESCIFNKKEPAQKRRKAEDKLNRLRMRYHGIA